MNLITPNIQLRCTRWVKDPDRQVVDDEGKTRSPWKRGDTVPVVAVSVVVGEEYPPIADVFLFDVLGRAIDPYWSSVPQTPDAALEASDFEDHWPTLVEWFNPAAGEWRPLPAAGEWRPLP